MVTGGGGDAAVEGGRAGAAEGGSASGAGGFGEPATPLAVPCVNDAPCRATGRLCDAQTFVCVECQTAEDCGPSELCSGGNQRCSCRTN